jgi:plastocyanin
MLRAEMTLRGLVRKQTLYTVVTVAFLPFALGAAVAAAASHEYVVSQLGRTFTPATLTIQRGETVHILNDDGDLLHHVYLQNNLFKFDSGDQKPGSRINIEFPITGTFTLLCAIHPKMKLVVEVK